MYKYTVKYKAHVEQLLTLASEKINEIFVRVTLIKTKWIDSKENLLDSKFSTKIEGKEQLLD